MAIGDNSRHISGAKLVSKVKGNHFHRQESKVENINYMIGKNVWIKVDTDELFAEATVKSIDSELICVKYKGEEITLRIDDCLNNLSDIEPLHISDLVKIPHANSAVVLDILNKRFQNDVIYTYAGKLLVALNPFKQLSNLYGESVIKKYCGAITKFGFPPDLEPHSYAVAQSAMNGLINNNRSQSCIVSGESGAGKTETAKQLMSFFAYGQTSNDNKVQNAILGTNLLLESFGNAKTLNNNNSSRFGKFLKLLLNPDGGIKGGVLSSYMLELSRIEFQNENERNFHIFYQCIKGLSNEEKGIYGFLSLDSYKFLNKWKCYDAPGIDDIKDFAELRKQLKILFSEEDCVNFFKCISGILLLGNVEFEETSAMGVDNAAKISNDDTFQDMCNLLGIDPELARKAVTQKVVAINNSVIESSVTTAIAEVNTKAMAKDLYGALFEYCIDSVNQIIQFDSDANNWIGILDIYGFEYFEHNTYEQLLINYANERLQKYFINQVFQSEVNIYQEEGIDHSCIVFTDNSNILQIFDKPNQSIFSFLEEQCLIQTGSSEKFTQSCKSKINNDNFLPSKGEQCSFTIVHTAATVTYNTEEFVVKNKHKLSQSILDLLINSKNHLVCECSKKIPNENGNMKGKFLGSLFQKSILSLMNCLETTDSHFVRCIKTNQEKIPNFYNFKGVYDQLISLSILESIQTIHRGFAYKALFSEFIKENELLSSVSSSSQNSPEDLKANVKSILDNLAIPQSEYRIGKTKLFLRKNGWILLEQNFLQFTNMLKPMGDLLYRYYRSNLTKRIFNNTKALIIRLQSNIRRFNVQGCKMKKLEDISNFVGTFLILDFINRKDKKEAAAVFIQSFFRMYIIRKSYLDRLETFRKELIKQRVEKNLKLFKRCYNVLSITNYLKNIYRSALLNKSATIIASGWRMHLAIKLANELRISKIREFSAIFIQKHIRGYLQRKIYTYIREITPYIILIQAFARGYLIRKRFDGNYKHFTSIRRRLKFSKCLVFLQNSIRAITARNLLYVFYQDVLTIQSFFWTRYWYREFYRIQNADAIIKSTWRSYKFKSIIRDEKEKLLIRSQKREVEDITRTETLTSLLIFNKYKNSVDSWLPIHINVSTSLKEFYPRGWSQTLLHIINLNGKRTITGLSMGAFHTVVVLDGIYVHTFGLNDRGQLGTSIKHQKETSEPITIIKERLLIKDVQCGIEHTLLLLNDGSVYSWGFNKHGQCGIGCKDEIVDKPTLVRFPVLNGAPVIISKISAGEYHNLALTEDGRLYIWGRGTHTNLAVCSDKTKLSDIFKPLEIFSSHGNRYSGPRKIKNIFCGKQVTYLLSEEDNLYSFGNSYNGQLGHNTVDRPSNGLHMDRLQVLGIGKVALFAHGPNFTISTDIFGNIYQWGTILTVNPDTNEYSKVVIHKPIPVDIDKDVIGSPPVKITIGWWETTILTEDLTVWGWNYSVIGATIRPVLYRYSILDDVSCSDILSLSSPALSSTLVKL
ncbi:myosin B, putative [Theileria equi strain WA]|uniref:Myosin B, putative n=1 Tax=Theileria equi strain WA TaxID=1537102 RepID=L1LFX2_THEEQ|nr:myosin B, putative [Theileria equi strain WA]EKX74322.1 myosin B, putative [Theileria equi strain WA]|eukprot:XP_004833774.1 myosin B, putative [Theileria equi strain WA]